VKSQLGNWHGAGMRLLLTECLTETGLTMLFPVRKLISTTKAPAPIGLYSQVAQVNRTIYTSGQVDMDPASGQLVPGLVVEETKQTL
jgi:hypothetical protein